MTSNGTKLCQGKDVFERMNFLYQASRLVSKSSKVAASHYGNLMVSCAKKAVLRMEPDIKRTICKNCHSPLIPGETARVRLVSKPVKAVKWTCLRCGAMRRIPTKRGYKLWGSEPEAVVQVYDYSEQKKALEIDPAKNLAAESHPVESGTVEGKKREDFLAPVVDSLVESHSIELGTAVEKMQENSEDLVAKNRSAESGTIEEKEQKDSSTFVTEKMESTGRMI